MEVCCSAACGTLTSDERVLPLAQVTTFDIGEFNAMITDPSWVQEYAMAQAPYLNPKPLSAPTQVTMEVANGRPNNGGANPKLAGVGIIFKV